MMSVFVAQGCLSESKNQNPEDNPTKQYNLEGTYHA